MIKKDLTSQQVIVAGGGLSGFITSIILARAGLNVSIIEKKDLSNSPPPLDLRSLSLSYKTYELLNQWNIWNELEQVAGPIEQIRVNDDYSTAFVHFEAIKEQDHPMGYMVLNKNLIAHMWNIVNSTDNITICSGQNIEKISYQGQKIIIGTDRQDFAADLLIAADGKFSTVRKLHNISVFHYDYKQKALVFNIKHQESHDHTAFEIFQPQGPFAVLPLLDLYQSSIVWTDTPEQIDCYQNMTPEDFIFFLDKKMQGYFGKIEITSPLASYPLSVSIAKNYFAERTALVADAAHAIHPLAGQGLNQGILDIEILTNKVIEYHKLGLDIGCKSMLEEYQRARKFDNLAMYHITDTLNKMFSNNNLLLKPFRRLGLRAVNNIPKLKSFFTNYAMGNNR